MKVNNMIFSPSKL